jgi:hypothetical protein
MNLSSLRAAVRRLERQVNLLNQGDTDDPETRLRLDATLRRVADLALGPKSRHVQPGESPA